MKEDDVCYLRCMEGRPACQQLIDNAAQSPQVRAAHDVWSMQEDINKQTENKQTKQTDRHTSKRRDRQTDRQNLLKATFSWRSSGETYSAVPTKELALSGKIYIYIYIYI